MGEGPKIKKGSVKRRPPASTSASGEIRTRDWTQGPVTTLVWRVADSVREGDVVHRPVQMRLSVAEPRLFVFDREIVDTVNTFGASEAGVLGVPPEQVEQNQFPESTQGCAFVHSKRGNRALIRHEPQAGIGPA